MNTNWRVRAELTEYEKKLAGAAKRGSQAAVRQAFAAGLSILIERDGRLIRIFPDRHEVLEPTHD